MDIDFTPEERMFRDEVRAFLRDNWQRILNDRGWAAPNWPVECGGTGWSPVQRYIFDKECAMAGAPGLAVLGLKLVGPVICEFGTPEQKARFLPRIRSGEDYWCQGYSEPGSGSDLASLRCSARRDGDDYVVNGSKIWTTHAHYANWIFALVRTDTTVRKQAGITFLLIPMDQPGISVAPILTMAGDHEVNQVFFDNARSSVANRIGEEGQGWTIAKFLLENERGGSCHAPRLLRAIAGLESQARMLSTGYNGTLWDDAEIRNRIARVRLDAEALEVTELRILADLAKGRAPGPQTSLVKWLGSDRSHRARHPWL